MGSAQRVNSVEPFHQYKGLSLALWTVRKNDKLSMSELTRHDDRADGRGGNGTVPDSINDKMCPPGQLAHK